MVQCVQKPMSCTICVSMEAFLHPAVSWSSLILGVRIRSPCWFLCRQKLMPDHLDVLRPGLRWQTTGDKEENSALQFRTVPTELPRLTKQTCVCAQTRCISLGCSVCILVGWLNFLLLQERECRVRIARWEMHVNVECCTLASRILMPWPDICLHPVSPANVCGSK